MNLNKILLITALAIVSGCKTNTASDISQKLEASEKSKKPNLLLIITDEHNFRTIGAYRDLLSKDQAYMWGDAVVETPNIDFIGKNGAVFNSMYASSPVCTPSRASMFTGLYPQNTGSHTNNLPMKQDVPTIADVLSKEGYVTGYAGKWHLSGEAKPGWAPEYKYGFQDNRYMFNRGHWKNIELLEDGTPQLIGKKGKDGYPKSKAAKATPETFTTDFLTNRAIDFIDQNKENPFFYVVSIPDPHTPDDVRKPYNTMYKDIEVKLPISYNKTITKDTPSWQKPDKKSNNKEKMTKMVKQYYGMVKCIDDNVGRMIEKLKMDGLLDNTIVVFASDHGDLLGEHHRVNKSVPQEGASRIPFLVYYPDAIKKGTVVNEAANTTDWMSTFLSLMNIENTPQTEGRDLTPLLKKSTKATWNDISFVRMGNWAFAVSDRYKLIVDTNNTPWLSDLEVDPNELVNYVNDPKYKLIVNNLAKELLNYGSQYNDGTVKKAKFQERLNKLIQ